MPEWGFPKGKRNYQETDFKCATREFYEETGYSSDDINILINVMPYEEVFIGSNFKTYKHKYYIANFKGDNKKINFQISEISDMKWFTFEKCKTSKLKVRIKNTNTIPEWHLRAGKGTWLFVDELIFE